MNRVIKKLIAGVMGVVTVFTIGACSRNTDMPYNGRVEFHDIEITIPADFIRDSGESDEDFWVFERDNYDEYILLQYREADDALNAMLAYGSSIREDGAEVDSGNFIEYDAIMAHYTQDDLECYEMMFVMDDSIYSIAIRGGSEDDIYELTDSIDIVED